ncbi:MAG TPA: SDR family oxidoreductase [Thermoanaerobaculia bacterium]|nr:SDR family oxidoreductase [Thermoanaerobaculia bacterium]
MTAPRVLLTGATGYVGGRLLGELERRGVPVRCLARRPEALRGRAAPSTEIVAGDALDAVAVRRALDGVSVVYYLIHSMGGEDFAARDREAAGILGRAAREAGVRRIIYLGGLGDRADGLSEHLRSRQETGEILRSSGVPVVELRASIVLGSGSLSFEMIRALVERLPVMICPRWVAVEAQPIAIEDLIAYLAAALDLPPGAERIYEIGGPDRVTYGDLMREYARQRGLKRLLIPVPLLTPRLSSLWLGLVTPLYARVGRKLVDSLRNPTVVRDPAALAVFPVKPRGVREAIARALVNEDEAFARTRWSDAESSSGLTERYGGDRVGTRLIDSRKTFVRVPPAAAFAPIRRIGGDAGWYYGNFLWRLRGFLDLLVGGVGLRRGRRRADALDPGDALDFWRVESFEPDRLLRLRAEMKVPGRAWLQFETTPIPGGTEIRQTAIFDASGLFGLAYWYALYPLHRFVFAGMLRGIAHRAQDSTAR